MAAEGRHVINVIADAPQPGLTAHVKPKHATGAARPWPSAETPTVHTDRPNCANRPSQVFAPTVLTARTPVRYTSVDSAI